MADEKKILLSVQVKADQALAEMAKTRKEIAELKSLQKQLDTSTEEGRLQYEKYGASIREANKRLREQQKVYDNHIKTLFAQEDSLEALRAELSNLTLAYTKLSKAERESAEGQELKEKIKGISDELKETEGGIGQFNRNVGDYENAIKRALAESNGLIGGFMKMRDSAKETGVSFRTQAVTGVKAFGKALLQLMKIPIVLVLSAIVAAVMSLFNAFKQTDDGATIITGTLKALNNILKVLRDRLVGVLDMLKALLTFDFEGLKDSATRTFGGIGSAIRDAAQAGWEYEQQMDRIADKESGNLVRNARIRRQIEELKNVSKDRTKSDQERLAASQKAGELELQLLQRNKDIKEEYLNNEIKNLSGVSGIKEEQINKWIELDGIEQEQLKEKSAVYADFYNKNEDAIQKIQEMKAENIDLDSQYYTATRRLASEQSGLILSIQNENAAKAKEIAQKRKELAEKIAQAENELINLSLSSEAKALKEKADNEDLHYEERFVYLEQYKAKQKELIDANANYEKSKAGLTKSEIAVIDEKAKQAKIAVEKEAQQMVEDTFKQHAEKMQKEYQRQANDRAVEIDKEYEDEYTKLIKLYDKKKLTTEQFEKQVKDLKTKYQNKQFDESLAILEKQLETEGLTEEQLFDIFRAIQQKKLEMQQAANDAMLESTRERAEREKDIEERLLEKRKELYEQLQETIRDITMGIYESKIQNLESESEKVQTETDKQIAEIEKREKSGVISKRQAEAEKQKIDSQARKKQEQLEAEKKKAARDQAIAERLFAVFSIGLSTGKAVMAALAPPPTGLGPVAGVPLSIATGAIGALQIASALAQPLPKAARGRYITGKPHLLGGEIIEAEGGEMVINKKSASMFAPLLSAINEAGGGDRLVPYSGILRDGGYAVRTINRSELSKSDISDAMEKAVKKVKIYTTVEDIRREDKLYSEIEHRSTN